VKVSSPAACAVSACSVRWARLTDERLTAIAAGRFRRPRYVWSTYFFEALRRQFGAYSVNRYTELFDQAEILFSLIVADQMVVQDRVYAEPWLGRFVDAVADSRSFDDSFAG
jgi:hypothetical protein